MKTFNGLNFFLVSPNFALAIDSVFVNLAHSVFAFGL